MLRHKYTKKRLRNKFNQKKRTRRQRGGVRNPKKKISSKKKKEMIRLSLGQSNLPESCKKPTSKVLCNRYCKAEGVNDPKCDCCPDSKAATDAIKKQNQLPLVSLKQEEPIQPAVVVEERPQEIKVTETQKTDPTPAPIIKVPQTIIQSPEPKPVKKNKTCFETQIDKTSGEVYYVEKNKDGTYTNKSQWEKPPSKQMCKRNSKMKRCKTNSECTDPEKPYCNLVQEKCAKLPEEWGWTTAVDESGNAYFYGQYSDGTYSESQYDVPTKAFDKDSNKTQPTTEQPAGDAKNNEDGCFVPIRDETHDRDYYVKKKPDGTFAEGSQWEEPPADQMCKNDDSSKQQPTTEQPAGDAKNNEDGCFVPIRDETHDRDYYVKKKPDGTFAEGSQWEEPPADQMCKNDDSLRQKTWDADKTIGSCREMDLHPGTEYWVDPETKRMSFEPIEGVKKNTVTEETDYYYNNEGKTTFDPHDGTCGDTKADDVKIKQTDTKKDYIKMFFSSHFKKIKQIDDSLDSNKVIPWLAKR